MTRQTDLHSYTVPTTGDKDYESTFSTYFDDIDSDVPIRDVESNLSNYTPKSGAKFLATDTENEFIGDGSAWNQLQTAGPNPSYDSVTTADLTHTPTQDVPQSVMANITDGQVVAERPGTGVKSIDPTSVGDTAAVQDAVKYLEANGGGTVHIPTRKKDGSKLVISSTVSTDDADREPVSIKVHGHGRGVTPDTDNTQLFTNVSTGPVFRITGDIADDSSVQVRVDLGVVYGQGGDDLLEIDTASATVNFDYISGFAGDAIRVQNRSFDGAIMPGVIDGLNNTTRAIVFTSGSNGNPSDWQVFASCSGTNYDVCVYDDVGSDAKLYGHYEGAGGRAVIDIPSGPVTIDTSARIDVTDGGGTGARHGVYLGGGGPSKIDPRWIGAVDGDGIHMANNAFAKIGDINFAAGITGSAINVQGFNTGRKTVLPDRNTLDDSVNYPSGTTQVYERDATQL